MNVPIDEIIDEALSWTGTPYRHQSSCKGAGADCLGLLRGVWRSIYGSEPETVPPYSSDWSEPSGEERLWQAATRHLIRKPLKDANVGDVLLFRMRNAGVAKHLGLMTDISKTPRFIHAYSGQGVVVSPYSGPWARRVVARFSFPERAS